MKTEAVPNTPEILQPTPDKTETQAVAMATSDPVTKGDQESGAAAVEVEGASGYSKEPVFELFCGNQDVDGSTMYVVDPLSWCPHLDSVTPVPAGGIDVFRPCEDCGSDAENWICLCCYKVYCGRYVNQHMLTHGVVSEHRLVLSFADLSVWCYSCQAYVHNQKFGTRTKGNESS
ncbi:histone deacetylase 6-like [Salvelinus sp. IW2-2015]|uniref:histone deacetylase 6-like n=1 Tax=Salvelinus sp. IW2-2015 TaxID=2691554 RepID=UPI0038D45DC6